MLNSKLLVNMAGTFLKNNSQNICLAGAIAGVVTTAVTAVHAHTLYLDRLAEYADDTEQVVTEIPLAEKLKVSWDIWVPPLLSGAATVTFILAANVLLSKKYAAAVAAYSLSTEAFEQYREVVASRLGNEEAANMLESLPITPEARSVAFVSNSEEYWFRDALSGREFLSTRTKVDAAVNNINYELIHDSTASLNRFYSRVGLDVTEMGGLLGWVVGDPVQAQYRPIVAKDGRPMIQVDLFPEPRERFDIFG